MNIKTQTSYHVRRVSVNCCSNDPVDVRCGGPVMLGFDFCMDAELTPKEIRAFIVQELKKANKPCEGNINIDGPFWHDSFWTKEQVAKCIKEDKSVPTVGSREYERSLRGYR